MEIKRNLALGLTTIIVISSLFVNCKKVATPTVTKPVTGAIKDTSIVNRFIYNGLQEYYLWTDLVPKLAPAKYANKDSMNVFLNSYTDPQKIFTDLLYQDGTVDKWSFLVSDSLTITNWIQARGLPYGR